MKLQNLLKKNLVLEALWFGKVSYVNGMKLQDHYIRMVKKARECGQQSKNFLLLFEHNPVYTVGIRSQMYSAEEENKLKKLGAEFYRTNRGGLITFHGPGQLVAYPIIDLSSLRIHRSEESSVRVGVRRFVFLIEEVIIQTVKRFGIVDASRTSNTGVWVGNGTRKIAAIGISVRGGVSSHGLGLNCNTDLSWFNNIVPCGLVGKGVTSMSVECGKEIQVSEVLHSLSEQFADVFQTSLIYNDQHLEIDKLLNSLK
uniref:Octanoyl-[acyl-carrier-protein]:protein N-octanoyltransferase LIPT2, mitochondrial n=1 Tax=Syphacia muris TaxID=451379 RepID=A0A0N5AQZ4_9BILA